MRVTTHEFRPVTCDCTLAQEVTHHDDGRVVIATVGIVRKCPAHAHHDSPTALANAISAENWTLGVARAALHGTEAQMVGWEISERREVLFRVKGATPDLREKLGAISNLVPLHEGE